MSKKQKFKEFWNENKWSLLTIGTAAVGIFACIKWNNAELRGIQDRAEHYKLVAHLHSGDGIWKCVDQENGKFRLEAYDEKGTAE